MPHSRSVNIEAGRETVVLVVEDEPFVRLMAVEAIEDAGFFTVEADNADRALALLGERGDIDVMFSDIKMPGSMDGIGLAAAVSERWPDIRIILTSGHLYRDDTNLPAALPFIQKPYRARDLIAELRQVIR